MAKPGRNDPCHCGSGAKYKKRCLAKDEAAEREGMGEAHGARGARREDRAAERRLQVRELKIAMAARLAGAEGIEEDDTLMEESNAYHGDDGPLAVSDCEMHYTISRVFIEAARQVGATHVVLGLAEVGQTVSVAPSLVAELGPAVVFRAMAAGIDHAVDRRGTAERLAAWAEKRMAVAEVGIGLRVVAPIVLPAEHEVAERAWRMDELEAVLRPCLADAHVPARIGGQPIGQYAAVDPAPTMT
jgi:hypothetical protein